MHYNSLLHILSGLNRVAPLDTIRINAKDLAILLRIRATFMQRHFMIQFETIWILSQLATSFAMRVCGPQFQSALLQG